MSQLFVRKFAWLLWISALALVAIAFAFELADRNAERGSDDDSLAIGVLFAFEILAFASVGALLVARRPRNPIGWLLAGFGFMGAAAVGADGYARHTLFTDPGSLPAGEAAAWIAHFVIDAPAFAFGFFGLLFLLFPDGRLPSRVWRRLLAVVLPALALLQVVIVFRPKELDAFPGLENPLGISGVEKLAFLELPLFLLLLAFVVAAAISVIRRFFKATGEERQQLKVIVSACAFLAVTLASAPIWWSGFLPERIGEVIWPVFFASSLASIPVGVGVAILRYRLYDIDLIINRALVYATLTAFLAGLYAASVQLSKLVFEGVTGGSDAALVLTTLLLAAAFTPAKNNLQKIVDRYFSHVHDTSKELAAYDDRLRSLILFDVGESTRQFLELAVRSLGAPSGRIDLHDNGTLRCVALQGDPFDLVAARLPLRHAGLEVGVLNLGPRADGAAYVAGDLEALQATAGRLAHAISVAAAFAPSTQKAKAL